MNNIKKYRKNELRLYVIGNILVALYCFGYINSDLKIENTSLEIINFAIISSILYVYVYILDTVVPAGWKDKLVYVFTGKPGETIFTRIQKNNKDDRFTKEQVKDKYSDIYDRIKKFSDEKQKKEFENSSWYTIYKKHEDKSSVFVSQKDFLLNRDMSSMTLNMIVIYISIILTCNICLSCKYMTFLIIEFFVTNLAARERAMKFVYNVIAADV